MLAGRTDSVKNLPLLFLCFVCDYIAVELPLHSLTVVTLRPLVKMGDMLATPDLYGGAAMTSVSALRATSNATR